LAVRLYTPNLNNLGAKSPIVSGLHLKYSRFSETRARDRVRSALRGWDAVLAHFFSQEAEGGTAAKAKMSQTDLGEWPQNGHLTFRSRREAKVVQPIGYTIEKILGERKGVHYRADRYIWRVATKRLV
jgi:hypothetical protein